MPNLKKSQSKTLITAAFATYCLVWAGTLFWKTLGQSDHLTFFITLPAGSAKGMDLEEIISHYRNFFQNSDEAYQLPYPPFSAVLFYPLTFIAKTTSYFLVSGVTLLTLFWLLISEPFLSRADSSRIFAYGITFLLSINSYGLLFELERGQYNLLTIGITLAGSCLLDAAAWVCPSEFYCYHSASS